MYSKSNMKRILYIQAKFGLGGINKITSVKANYLVNHGYEVYNLNAQDAEALPPQGMYDEKIKMYSIPIERVNRFLSIPLLGHFL